MRLANRFVTVALCAARKLGKMDSLHLDSSSFHVDGNYINNTACEKHNQKELKLPMAIRETTRPEAIYFRLDVQWDGDIPLYLRGDGNESDSAMFATLLADFKRQWQIDALFVADAALYTQENLQQMFHLRWVSRVPGTLTAAKRC